MKKKIVSLLQYIFFLGLGIFLVWWSIRKINPKDWEDIRNSLNHANYWLIIPVVLVLLLSHISRAIRWRILMEPLGFKPKLVNTFMAVLIGYMANLAVPRLGEVLKCTALARYEKVPADKLVGTIVAERAFDVICLLVIVVITFLLQADIIGNYFSQVLNELFQSKAGGFTLSRLLIYGGVLAFGLFLLWFVFKKYSHIDFIQRIKKILKGIWEGLTSVRNVKSKGGFLFHTFFIWLMYLLSIQMGFFALQETSIYRLRESLSILTSGSFAMIVPTPGGLGVYPVFVQKTMELYGLKSSIGFAFGSLMWVVQFFQMLISGFIALAVLPWYNKK